MVIIFKINVAIPSRDGNIVYQFGYKEKKTLWSYQPVS
jgi:hypothetical protein